MNNCRYLLCRPFENDKNEFEWMEMMISTHSSNVDKIVYIDLGLNPTFHTKNGKCLPRYLRVSNLLILSCIYK